MSGYQFIPHDYPLITKPLIEEILHSKGEIVRTSLSLGKNYTEVTKKGNMLMIGGIEIDLKVVNENISNGYVYALKREGLFKIAFFRDHKYYRLLPIDPYSPPTLEISGIRMHRTKDVTPWEDAALKVSKLGEISGKRVLDVCTGLGYTAIQSLLKGAEEVVTIERDPNVLEVARYNPWSRELAHSKIIVALADASRYISSLEDSSYDAIIHDPPRLSLAGELYGNEFYKELYRVLEKGGVLVHYTGRPGYKVRGIDLMKNVSSRLSKIGFRTKIFRDLYIVVAHK
jgi:hypothetical protein